MYIRKSSRSMEKSKVNFQKYSKKISPQLGNKISWYGDIHKLIYTVKNLHRFPQFLPGSLRLVKTLTTEYSCWKCSRKFHTRSRNYTISTYTTPLSTPRTLYIQHTSVCALCPLGEIFPQLNSFQFKTKRREGSWTSSADIFSVFLTEKLTSS